MNDLMAFFMNGWQLVFSMEYNNQTVYVYLQNRAWSSSPLCVGLYI